MSTITRPEPPADLANPHRPTIGFQPAPELDAWARCSFIDSGGPLANPDHSHLQAARIGWLWTSAPNARGGRTIVGTAEVFRPKGGRWQIARQEYQLIEWFGTAELDFIVTLDAVYANLCGDLAFCALVEHELYHCGQATDEFGSPRFNSRTGRPFFALRSHDVEEFVGVVERYGAGAASGGVQALIQAASRKPTVGIADVASACGTCLKAVA